VLGQATWTYKNGAGAGDVLLREPWRDLCPVSLRAAGTAKTADASPNSASAWIALLILAFGKNEKPNGSCQLICNFKGILTFPCFKSHVRDFPQGFHSTKVPVP